MPRHQYGIFAEGTRSQHHLEFVVRPDVADDDLHRALCEIRRAGEDHRTNGSVNVVLGFGSELWARLRPEATDLPIGPFPGYRSPDGALEAPATQRDLWVWVHGPAADVVLDVAMAAVDVLADVADVALDLPAFVYKDSRDLTGFIDGSANPFLDEAPDVATIADGQPGEGGSCAMTMQFVHDLHAFHAQDVADQERTFGRTKADSIEMDDDVKPANAHIARVEVDDEDGEELDVYRRSVPWASATVQGLHFVSFGKDIARFDLQLRHQYGLVDDGITDHLLDFTTPLTGSFWFCPSVEELQAVAPLPDGSD